MLVGEHLDQVDQIGILYLLWSEDVPLVQLLHRSCSVDDKNTTLYWYLYIQSAEQRGWTLYRLRPRFWTPALKCYIYCSTSQTSLNTPAF